MDTERTDAALRGGMHFINQQPDESGTPSKLYQSYSIHDLFSYENPNHSSVNTKSFLTKNR